MDFRDKVKMLICLKAQQAEGTTKHKVPKGEEAEYGNWDSRESLTGSEEALCA